MARLDIQLLGPLRVALDGKIITTFKSNKVRALLAYLATEMQHAHPREALAELLWPDWPPQSAMNNLRYALVDLRKNIGDRGAQPPFLIISRAQIQFNPMADNRVDVSEFTTWANDLPTAITEAQANPEYFKSSFSAYNRPFLDGFSLADSSPFQEWVLQEREALNRQMLKTFSLLESYYERRDDSALALELAYQVLELRPWQEEAHQQVMRLLATQGQRSEALAQFEKCRRALAGELGVEPGAETLRLYENIRDGQLTGPKSKAGQPANSTASSVVLSTPSPEHKPLNNLPLQLTHFFGREQETLQVKDELAQGRLVTLTGPGGVGKTRLALHVAGEIPEMFKDGIWFVELAALSDPELVPQQIALSLGIEKDPHRSLTEFLIDFLCSKQTLLVLDNCEHLLDACSQISMALLRGCPGIRILATSREPLALSGEKVLRVTSLPFPDPNQALSADLMDSYAAINLFIDRARLAQPGYQVTSQNAPVLARICQRLDGIPLAIELVAARTGVLSIEQIAGRLEDTFHLLTGGSRDTLPRQQTLRGTIDWSYHLLNDQERLLFQRISVFTGGCTMEACEMVCSGKGLETGEILDLLTALVNKSMVIAVQPGNEQPRYHLLETIRQYASEKLADSGEVERLRTRHLDYFFELVEQQGNEGLRYGNFKVLKHRLRAEVENLRLALEWSFGSPGDAETAIKLVNMLDDFDVFLTFQEDSQWSQRAITLIQNGAPVSPFLLANFLGNAAHTAAGNDLSTALKLAEQSVSISRGLGEKGKAQLYSSLATLTWTLIMDLGDRVHSLAPLAEAGTLLEELGNSHFNKEEYYSQKAYITFLGARLAYLQGNYRESIAQNKEGLALVKLSGPMQYEHPHILFGEALVKLGEYGPAREHYLTALKIAEGNDENDTFLKAYAFRDLCFLDYIEGKLGKAREDCIQGLKQAVSVGDNNFIASFLGLSACILAKYDKPTQAARLSGASQVLYLKQGREPWEDAALDTILPKWRAGPEQEAILQAFEQGQAMPTTQAVDFCLKQMNSA